jgi:hypothetical protein
MLYVYTCVQAYIHTYTYRRTMLGLSRVKGRQGRFSACIHTHMCAYPHTHTYHRTMLGSSRVKGMYTYTYVQAYMHTYIHTYTYHRTMLGLSRVKGRQGRFGAVAGVQQTFAVVACLPSQADGDSIVLTGTEDGSVYVWDQGGRLLYIKPSVHAYGVLSLLSLEDRGLFVTGGGDACVRVWRLSSGEDYFDMVSSVDVRACFNNMSSSSNEGADASIGVCALAVKESFGGSREIAAGMGNNSVCVLSVNADGIVDAPRTRGVIEAHYGGKVTHVCVQPGHSDKSHSGHPGLRTESLVATAGCDACLRVWDVRKRSMVKTCRTQVCMYVCSSSVRKRSMVKICRTLVCVYVYVCMFAHFWCACFLSYSSASDWTYIRKYIHTHREKESERVRESRITAFD